MPKSEIPYQFEGWDSPNYTQTPDQLFDELLAPGVLTDPELRVLLYIVRRTYGFKKASDNISLGQITGGIVTADGRRLDGGAGVCKAAAVKAVKGLESKGIILRQRNRNAAKGDQPTTYSMRMRGTPVSTEQTRGVHETNTGGLPGTPAPVYPVNPQDTVGQERVRQEGITAENTIAATRPVPFLDAVHRTGTLLESRIAGSNLTPAPPQHAMELHEAAVRSAVRAWGKRHSWPLDRDSEAVILAVWESRGRPTAGDLTQALDQAALGARSLADVLARL